VDANQFRDFFSLNMQPSELASVSERQYFDVMTDKIRSVESVRTGALQAGLEGIQEDLTELRNTFSVTFTCAVVAFFVWSFGVWLIVVPLVRELRNYDATQQIC
jgi:hypothetical protein